VAQSLIKGCEYHWQKSVTRVSRIGDCVSPETQSQFLGMCRQLQSTENMGVFDRVVGVMRKEWPKLKRWLDWWLAPDHASMIFPTHRTM
ncbi:hypothetical protein K435DRAFT_637661, partial [Dendrothele bispora CBS 962.96]